MPDIPHLSLRTFTHTPAAMARTTMFVLSVAAILAGVFADRPATVQFGQPADPHIGRTVSFDKTESERGDGERVEVQASIKAKRLARKAEKKKRKAAGVAKRKEREAEEARFAEEKASKRGSSHSASSVPSSTSSTEPGSSASSKSSTSSTNSGISNSASSVPSSTSGTRPENSHSASPASSSSSTSEEDEEDEYEDDDSAVTGEEGEEEGEDVDHTAHYGSTGKDLSDYNTLAEAFVSHTQEAAEQAKAVHEAIKTLVEKTPHLVRAMQKSTGDLDKIRQNTFSTLAAQKERVNQGMNVEFPAEFSTSEGGPENEPPKRRFWNRLRS